MPLSPASSADPSEMEPCSTVLECPLSLSRQVYICGVSEEDVPVPATAADVHPRPDAIATLQDVAASVSQVRAGQVLMWQVASWGDMYPGP